MEGTRSIIIIPVRPRGMMKEGRKMSREKEIGKERDVGRDIGPM